jgi:hypothetical protein
MPETENEQTNELKPNDIYQEEDDDIPDAAQDLNPQQDPNYQGEQALKDQNNNGDQIYDTEEKDEASYKKE